MSMQTETINKGSRIINARQFNKQMNYNRITTELQPNNQLVRKLSDKQQNPYSSGP